MDLGIKGKTALVTGGSYGIGRAIALALAREGCRVAICARGADRLEATTAAIRACGVEALAMAADATQPETAGRVVDQMISAWGELHILVNNVGGGGGRELAPVETISAARYESVYNQNALTAVRFTLAAIPHMRRARWGRVVAIASLQGREGGGRPWYTMAKSAEISFMKTLAMKHELARDGITFNSVAPGRVMFDGNEWDEFRRENPAKFEQSVRDGVPVERIGTPEEIGSVVAFLCSAQASFVNGACFAVDGGESRSF